MTKNSSNGKSETTEPAQYEVGYGRPPKATRFKPGCSGNPKGRPKGSKAPKTLLEEALSSPSLSLRGASRERLSSGRPCLSLSSQKRSKAMPGRQVSW